MTTYEKSRAAWNAYATMDAPYLPSDLHGAIQVQLVRWQVRNFDLQPAGRFVLGIVEELGELGESIEMDDDAGVLDAIGDACVYATQLANAHRLDFGVLLVGALELKESQPADVALGRIAHAVLKTEQHIRGYDNPEKGRFEVAQGLVQLLHRLGVMAKLHKANLHEVYVDTAALVLKRDWRADPLRAGGEA